MSVLSGFVWSQSRGNSIQFIITDNHDGSYKFTTATGDEVGMGPEHIVLIRDQLLDRNSFWTDFPNPDLVGPWFSVPPQIVRSPGFRVSENRRVRNGNRSGNGRSGNLEYNTLFKTVRRGYNKKRQNAENTRSLLRAKNTKPNAKPTVNIRW